MGWKAGRKFHGSVKGFGRYPVYRSSSKSSGMHTKLHYYNVDDGKRQCSSLTMKGYFKDGDPYVLIWGSIDEENWWEHREMPRAGIDFIIYDGPIDDVKKYFADSQKMLSEVL